MKRTVCVLITVLLCCLTVSTAVLAEESAEAQPSFTPKVLVESYRAVAIDENGEKLSVDGIAAGQRIRLTVTLRNMSKDIGVVNMTVTATAPAEYFSLCNASRDIYIASLKADSSCEIIYEYDSKISAPSGEYSFDIAYDFNYLQGDSYSSSVGSGTARLKLTQEVKLQFDKILLPDELTVSDIVNASVSAINLGRCTVYNVRAIIEADGLAPNGTAYIGNIEAGQASSATVQVYVSSLSESETLYGYTNGKVCFYYEDEDGNEYSEESQFSVKINSPFTKADASENASPKQWWLIVGISATAILICGTGLAIAYTVKRKKYEKDN